MKLPEWAKWLARDEDGELWAYSAKPLKEKDFWHFKNSGDKWIWIEETDDTFSHIRWEDEEPTELTTLREWVKWLARDENNELWCYATKPYKEYGRWHSEDPTGRCEKVDTVSEIYNLIQWTDKEPTEVISGRGTLGISVAELNRITSAKAHGYDSVPEMVETPDIINEQNHYKGKHGIETIDVIRTFGNDDMIAGFYWGNAIEYMTHYRNKNGLEDLKKARKNLDWLIEHMEGF